MAYPGKTEYLLGEDCATKIYAHTNREKTTGTVNGINKEFVMSGTPVAVTELSATIQAQYYSASSTYFRKDVFVEYYYEGVFTPVDTNSNSISISGTTITFTTAPATTEAAWVAASWSNSVDNRTSEVTNVTIGGGGRPVERIVVEGGTTINIDKIQENKTVTFEVLSVEEGFVDYINGSLVTETSGSDYIDGTVGQQTRSAKTIIRRTTDVRTSNVRIDCFFNVKAVTLEGSEPVDGAKKETVSFETTPLDFCRLSVRDDQV